MKRNSIFSAALAALLLIAPAATAQTQSMAAYESVTAENSRMWVEGTSTIHDWECPVNDFTAQIRAAADGEDGEMLASIGRISVTAAVESIECEKGKMNRKLRDALLSDDFPDVTFEAESAEITASEAGPTAYAVGTLTMAGETRDLSVSATISRTDDGRILLTGRAPIVLTSFGIDPPTALLGTLKTGDEVFVRFEVVLGEQQAN
ncbi:MAG: YceI family protein [Rhodothermales bacterium]|nr:YceI family protein [Rhodothermales bacterium]